MLISINKKRQVFKIGKSIHDLQSLLNNQLPTHDQCFKIIGLEKSFSIISFILFISEKEGIKELRASTLRIGKKELRLLANLGLKDVKIILGGLMKENKSKSNKNYSYSYWEDFETRAKDLNWKFKVVNNHSKIYLIKTLKNWYVIETSANLNTNSKIEQYSFYNDKKAYNFYNTHFFGDSLWQSEY